MPMQMPDHARRLARAVAAAAQEHGVPNGFGLAELETLYDAPDRLRAGRVLAQYRPVLARCLAELGYTLIAVDRARSRELSVTTIRVAGRGAA